MGLQRKITKYTLLILSAVILGFINFKQGLQKILIYMNDFNMILSKNEVFDRIFINIDFTNHEYMEGNSPFHYIGPFMFYVVAIFWGSYSFLLLKKNYHQFVFTRAQSKKVGYNFIKGNYITKILLFVFSYFGSILFLIIIENQLAFLDFQEVLIKSLCLAISSSLLVIGLTNLMLYIYIKFDEVIALLTIFISLIFLFAFNLVFKKMSIIFIGEDPFFLVGILVGICFILISKALLTILKYELE